MRTIFVLCALIFVIGAVLIWRFRQLPTHYGEFIGAPQTSVDDLVNHPQEFAGKTVSVQGIVRDQPENMRCHFFFPATNGMLRVELNAITEDAPKREGHLARVEGQLVPYNDGFELYASAVDFSVRQP